MLILSEFNPNTILHYCKLCFSQHNSRVSEMSHIVNVSEIYYRCLFNWGYELLSIYVGLKFKVSELTQFTENK